MAADSRLQTRSLGLVTGRDAPTSPVANGDLTAGSTGLVVRGFLMDACTNFLGEDTVTIVP